MKVIDNSYSIYSQYGEDGVLQFLINELKLNNKQCCEVGMNHLIFSNTYNLVQNYGWYGVYIDKNPFHLPQLEGGLIIHEEITTIGETRLDNVLKKTDLVLDFDILSIDIDGNDYHVWDSLKDYKPKVVVIEINPFFDCQTEHVYDGKIFSSSFKSTVNLAKNKNYSLVCMTGNLIFVKNELLYDSSLSNYIYNDPCDLFLDDAIGIGKREISFKRYMKTNKLL